MTTAAERLSILLPNKTPLRCKFPRDRGTDTAWFRQWITKYHLNTTKQYAPLYDFWSNLPKGTKQQHVILADFDCKHVDTQGKIHDIALQLLTSQPNICILKSVSGNIKLGYVIETTQRPSKQEAEAYLLAKLPPELHWFDRQGMSRCYMNKDNFEHNKQVLASVTLPEYVLLKQLQIKKDTVPAAVNLPFIEAILAHLPEELKLWAKDSKRQKLLQILTATWGLLEQYNLPQSKLAAQLGCSLTHVSTLMKELRNLGVLKITDKSFIQGVKAQTYKATGCLYKAIQKHKAQPRTKKEALPTVIIPHTFHRLCLRALYRFASPTHFLSYADSLAGITPTRRKEAVRYAACHFRKIAA